MAKGMLPVNPIDDVVAQAINQGLLPVDVEAVQLPPMAGPNVPPLPPEEIAPQNAMIAQQEQPMQLPPAQQINRMFEAPPETAAISNALGLAPERAAGLEMAFQGLRQIEDAYNRANLPYSVYLKMKEQEDNAEIKRQQALVQSYQLESDLNFRQQQLELQREQNAIQRMQVLTRGGPTPSSFMADAQILMQNNPNLNLADAYSMARSGVGKGLTIDPATGQMIQIEGAGAAMGGLEGTVAGARTAATERAKSEVEKIQSAPQASRTAAEMVNTIDKVISSPGLSYAVGKSSVLPVIPGTNPADFLTELEKLQGKAFLQAFESLKGGGQITQIEGEKATQAIANLKREQTEEGFKKSLQELRDLALSAKARADALIGGGQAAPAAPVLPVIDPEDLKYLTPEERALFNGQ